MALLQVTKYRAALMTVAFAAVSVTLFLIVSGYTGRLVENGGRGWDGVAYLDMLREGVLTRSSNERLRPVIVLFNRPLYWLSDRSMAGAIDAFAAMNVAYTAWLGVAVVLLASAYGASEAAQLFLVLNLALCVATSKYFAYYPTLVDLGAYAVIMTAMYAAVRRKAVPAAIFAVLAAMSREFGLAVGLFGVHRELRLKGGVLRAAAIYAPALLVNIIWRILLARVPGYGVLKPNDLAHNLFIWRDGTFDVLFLYFSVTVFGGVSMLLVARAGECLRFIRLEPEWATFAGSIVVMAARPDIWRYLAYTLPAAVALFAWCERSWTMARRVRLFTIATVGTLITQRPFEQIDGTTYFSHWFPYWVIPSAAPDDLERLWGYWGAMMLATVIIVWLMGSFDYPTASLLNRGRKDTREPRSPDSPSISPDSGI